MKKMMLVAAACAMVAAPSMILADDAEVTSVNAVGYYSVTIPNNGLALVTPVLENMEGATIQELIGTQLPNGSEAILWDRVNKGYVFGSVSRGTWDMTNIILRGDALWLRPAPGSGEIVVTFMGEVPTTTQHGDTTVVGNISGTDAIGYAYPVDVVWTDTELAAVVPNGSELIVWDIQAQSYSFYSKSRGAWDTPSQFQIKAGHGFWIRSADLVDWEEPVPYSL